MNSAEFYINDSSVKLENPKYMVHLGPHFFQNTFDSKNQFPQYWMEPYKLSKTGEDGRWTDVGTSAVRPTPFCTGWIDFPFSDETEISELKQVTKIVVKMTVRGVS